MLLINVFGLAFMTLIILPNIIYALRHRDEFSPVGHNRWLVMAENIGRYGCIAFMVLKIPGLWLGWHSWRALWVYLVFNSVLAAAYIILWIILWRRDGMFRAAALSALPSAIFLLSGITAWNIPLVVSALVFAPSHIYISCSSAAKGTSDD